MKLNKDVLESVIMDLHNDLKVEIVFENSEWITIPFTSIKNIAYKVREEKDVLEDPYKVLDMLKLEIDDVGLIASELYTKISPFSRLRQYRDISQLIIINNGKENTYFINYENEAKDLIGSQNKNQTTYVNGNGNLIIDIFAKEMFMQARA